MKDNQLFLGWEDGSLRAITDMREFGYKYIPKGILWEHLTKAERVELTRLESSMVPGDKETMARNLCAVMQDGGNDWAGPIIIMYITGVLFIQPMLMHGIYRSELLSG